MSCAAVPEVPDCPVSVAAAPEVPACNPFTLQQFTSGEAMGHDDTKGITAGERGKEREIKERVRERERERGRGREREGERGREIDKNDEER